MTTPKPKTRRRRWLAVAAGLMVVLSVVTPLGLRWWAIARADRDLAAAVAEADADDPDWRWDALNAARTRPPAGKNAADVVAAFRGQLPPGHWGERLNPDSEGVPARVPPNARHHEQVDDEAGQELDRCAAALATARTLRDFPSGHRELTPRPDFISTDLNATQATRAAVFMLGWAAEREARAGRFGEAVETAHAALNASRSVGDEPTVISQLVRSSTRAGAVLALERVLGQGVPPADGLAAIQSALAADAEEPLALHGLRGERAGMDILMGNVLSGVLPADTIGDPPDPARRLGPGLGWWVCRDIAVSERAKLLRAHTRFVAAARRPVHEQPAAFRAAFPGGESLAEWRTGLLASAHAHLDWFWRGVAHTRSAAVGVACERFRQRTGRWPNALTELAPDLLREVPLDPFDGKPLRYARTADGVVIYSVGLDGTDDSGTPRDDRPDHRGTDVVFRLYEPDKRGLPPPPEEAPEPRRIDPFEVDP